LESRILVRLQTVIRYCVSVILHPPFYYSRTFRYGSAFNLCSPFTLCPTFAKKMSPNRKQKNSVTKSRVQPRWVFDRPFEILRCDAIPESPKNALLGRSHSSTWQDC